MRQKVVSILLLLGVVFSIFRCGSGSSSEEKIGKYGVEHEPMHGEEVTHESATHEEEGEPVGVVSHTTESLAKANDKTLFIKSEEDKAREKVQAAEAEAQRVAKEAEAAAHSRAKAQAAEQVKEDARLAAEAKAKAAADKVAQDKAARLADVKAKAEAKIAAVKAETATKTQMKMDLLRIAKDKAELEKEKAILGVNITSIEEAVRVVTSQRDELEGQKKSLLVKIEEWEKKATDAQATSKKMKVAAAAAALLATQQAVANAKSEDEEVANKLRKELESVKVIEEKAEQEKAELMDKLAALEKEKESLQVANTELNGTLESTKADLLSKIEEWEKKAADADHSGEDKTEKTALLSRAELAERKAIDEEVMISKLQEELEALKSKNTEMNASVASDKESLLAKLSEWEKKAMDAESKSKKLKVAAAAAATLAAQQAVANASSASDEALAKLKEELEAMKAQKALLESANSEMNATMVSGQTELLAKAEEAEKKAALAEENAKKLQAELEALKAEDEKVKAEKAKAEEEKEVLKKQAAENAAKAAAAAAALAKQAEASKAAEAERQAKEEAKKAEEEAKLAEVAAQAEAKRKAKEDLDNALAMSRVEFKYGSAQLTKKSENLLDNVANIIKENANLSYDIQGHTDAHGNEDYNVKLSASRAEKVKEYLISKEIDADILSAQGFGSSMPIADNSTNEGRLQNRRVVIKIVE